MSEVITTRYPTLTRQEREQCKELRRPVSEKKNLIRNNKFNLKERKFNKLFEYQQSLERNTKQELEAHEERTRQEWEQNKNNRQQDKEIYN